MNRLLRLSRLAVMIAAGILVMGLAVNAQEAGLGLFEFERPVAPDALWEKFQAAREALDESVVYASNDLAALATEVSTLLLGDDVEPGLIGLVQELAGVEDDSLVDAQAVTAGNTDPPELIALAHLILAAQAIEGTVDVDSLLEAGRHITEAEKLLSYLKPAEDAAE